MHPIIIVKCFQDVLDVTTKDGATADTRMDQHSSQLV